MAYILRGRKSGTVRFNDAGTVTDESKKFSGKVTSYPVEENSNISEHIERDPATGTIRGVLVDGGASVARLEKMFLTGDICEYVGSYRMNNIILTILDFSTNSANRNGFSFTANFQRIDIVSVQYVPVGATPMMSAQDSGKSSSSQANSAPANHGLQTTTTAAISTSAYAAYVDSFNSKPAASSGPASRSTPVYTG